MSDSKVSTPLPGGATQSRALSSPAHRLSRSEKSGIARMENEGGPCGRAPSGSECLEDALTRFGIVSVAVTTFEWGGYRYTNAKDAIAAAKRALPE